MRHMFILVIIALVFVSNSDAQFNCGWQSVNSVTGEYFALKGMCGEGLPFEDGTPIFIYWDANSNGPDMADQQPVVGSGFGQCNYNTFAINGEAELGIPGAFFAIETFTISSHTPQPSRYYLVVESGPCADRWESVVVTVNDGYSEPTLESGAEWSCMLSSPVPPAPIEIVTVGGRDFLPDGEVYNQCIMFWCGSAEVIIGPLSSDEEPILEFLPGCVGNGCDEDCSPTTVVTSYMYWYNNYWYLSALATNYGCACLRMEDILSSENGKFEAIAGDNNVELHWTTYSELNVAHFDLKRKTISDDEFTKIDEVEAVNSTSGATYTFVDNGAVNGTAYEYTLETVNLDGSHEAWGVIVSATPMARVAVIKEYLLHQNFPNPFNSNTNISFDLVEENTVNLVVYNAMGQEVATLLNEVVGAGRHTTLFDASNLTTGLYFYTVKIGNEFSATKKMLFVK